MASSWSWRAAEGHDPGDLGLGSGFPTQGEAESWLGEEYLELRAAGVRSVSLYEDERPVYGPMSLDP